MKKEHDRVAAVRGNLIRIRAKGPALGELASLTRADGKKSLASVLKVDEESVTLQVFESTRGISTADRCTFLGKPLEVTFSQDLLGRRFNAVGVPMDQGPEVVGESIEVNQPSFNPAVRAVPREMVRTNIPMIDVFNTLVRSQKVPIFSVAGEPYNQLLMRIANQTDCDIVVIGGMGLRFDDYQQFIDNAEQSGSAGKTVMFVHRANDPPVECTLVPDMALAVAERFAIQGKNVLVLLTDMTSFADALKELSITMDQIPSNRGYPGSLYSDLAARYEKAVQIEGGGSITVVAVVTMPGDDVTHPVPDNTGYITEGQIYLVDRHIEPFGSLSRLKQLVIGKVTREDHSEVANTLIRLYADSRKARERQAMGFRVSYWDEKLLKFSKLFEEKMMSLQVNLPLEEALDLGWRILAHCFEPSEVGMKARLIEAFWPKGKD
jgi:V/A-type H+/Na+-transporting ATPase subunit B